MERTENGGLGMNKRFLIPWIKVVMTLLLFMPVPGFAAEMKCGGRKITLGTTRREVIARCGLPRTKRKYRDYAVITYVLSGGSMKMLTFRGDKLTKIDDMNQGFADPLYWDD